MERSRRFGAPPVEGSHSSSHSRLRTAPSDRYASMREVLVRYVSATLVDATLERALRSRRLRPEALGEEALQELASDVMVGLRLFVPEQKLSQLMLDLAEVLDPQ